MEWNKVYYIDCMDPEKGLPSLPDKSVDLCITDFPFNVKFKGTAQKKQNEKYYEDNMNQEEYEQWCGKVFRELKKITRGQIIFCGNINLGIWYNIEIPRDLVIHYIPNKQGRASVSYLCKFDSILFYGQFNGKLSTNVIKKNVKIGKKRELQNGIHPCPGVYELYEKIIYEINPKSVIDPFLGSGTTVEVCTKLGIPWIGYEIKEVYSQDINKRLKNCRKEPQQVGLDGFMADGG